MSRASRTSRESGGPFAESIDIDDARGDRPFERAARTLTQPDVRSRSGNAAEDEAAGAIGMTECVGSTRAADIISQWAAQKSHPLDPHGRDDTSPTGGKA